MVRVPGSKPRGPGFDSLAYHLLLVAEALKWGPLSFVRVIEELLE
jgi:hypothetical protein